MPRILNRPPAFPKKKKNNNGSFLSAKGSTTSSPSTTISGLSRSSRSHFLDGIGMTEELSPSHRDTQQTLNKSTVSQITYDASMSNAAYDQASGRIQNADWGHFVDFYDPDSRDEEESSSFWREATLARG